jgi:hypothetical protein
MCAGPNFSDLPTYQDLVRGLQRVDELGGNAVRAQTQCALMAKALFLHSLLQL